MVNHKSNGDSLARGAHNHLLQCPRLMPLNQFAKFYPFLSQLALATKHPMVQPSYVLFSAVGTIVFLFRPFHNAVDVEHMLTLGFEVGLFVQAETAFFFCR